MPKLQDSSAQQGTQRFSTPAPNSRVASMVGIVTMSVVAGVLLAIGLIPFTVFTGAIANNGVQIFENLPDHIDPTRVAQPSRIFAKRSDGSEEEIAQFYAQNRQMVGWEDISQFAKDAAVAEEDPRFYSHNGVDVLALFRATVMNALGAKTSGASTITMQYARNLLVQESELIADEEQREEAYNDAMRQDIDRKLKEMKLAISIEKKYSKNDILLGYLNITNYGGQVYGIEAAARRYFNTTAKDLTLPQAASLIATVNAPSVLNLGDEENFERNKKRRNLILHSMWERGKITQEQYEEAINTPIETHLTSTLSGCQTVPDPSLGHFCNYVTLQIMNDQKFGATQEERWYNFQRGGYQIMTTLDLDIQRTAYEAYKNGVPARIRDLDLGSTIVSTEVGTGRVLAMVQNRPFSNDPEFLSENPDYTSINYATDHEYGGSNGFQIGSTMKPFTLAEWIRNGHSPNERVQTSGRTVALDSFKASCLPDGVYGHGSWRFNNDASGTTGYQTVTTATTLSVNGGYVSMAQQLDLCKIMELAENMGLHRAVKQTFNSALTNYNTRKLTVVPSNTFGGIDEIAPITMAAAYAGFAGNGTVCTPIPIDSITDISGNPVEFTKSDCREGVSPDVAAGVASVLQDGVARGWASPTRSAIGVPHIGKTGTTDNRVDHWLVGASTKVSTAMWIGNVTGKRPLDSYGVYYKTSEIWPAVMNAVDRKYGGDRFPDPKQFAVETVDVPDVKGKTFEEARQILEQAGFRAEDAGTEDSALAAGLIARSDPAAGTKLSRGASISLWRSTGHEAVHRLPGLPDQATARTAADALNAAGYHKVFMECRSGREEPNVNDRVESMVPAPGTETPLSAQIILRLSC